MLCPDLISHIASFLGAADLINFSRTSKYFRHCTMHRLKLLRCISMGDAIDKGDLQLVKIIVEAGRHYGPHCTFRAAEYGHLEIIIYFRSLYISLHEDAVLIAARNKHTHVVSYYNRINNLSLV
jgi:hypothetical protein